MRRITSALSILMISGAVTAAPEPQATELGGGKLIPLLSVGLKHDDNIFSQASSEQSDTILTLKPSVQWLQEKDTTSVALTYSGDYGVYQDSDDDDYDDHTVSFDASLSPSDFVEVGFGASYGWLHDNRGEGSSEGLNAASRGEPDEYEISSVNLDLDFGRDSAMLGFLLQMSTDDIEYQNNLNETAFRNRDETDIVGRVYANISGGKTKLFVQASQKDNSYDENPILGGKLDSDEDGFSAGIEWEATGKTSGLIRVGEVDKEFDSSARKDGSINTWEVQVAWSPRTYSHILLNSSNEPRETNGTGNFIEAQDTSLTWLHAWSDDLSTTFTFTDGSDEYANASREDDRQNISLSLSYDWRRWMTIGANYTHSERDSNQNEFDFDRNIVSVSVDMSL